MLKEAILITTILLSVVHTINCQGLRSLYFGDTLEISNDEYPGQFPPSTTLYWNVVGPIGSVFYINSTNIQINSMDNLCFSTNEIEYCVTGNTINAKEWRSAYLNIRLYSTRSYGRFSILISCLRDNGITTTTTPTTTTSTTTPTTTTSTTTPTTTTPTTTPTTTTSTTTPTTTTSTTTPTTTTSTTTPTTTTTTTSTTTTPKPSTQCDCGVSKNGFMPGTVAEKDEFPFMAAILNPSTNSIVCGAVLISDQVALTAARCQESSLLVLVVGEYNAFNLKSATRYSIRFTKHPKYDRINSVNDIAYVKTTTPITLNPSIGKICLPFNFNLQDGSYDVRALGWGIKMTQNPSILKKADLKTLTLEDCKVKKNFTIHENQMCVYDANINGCTYDVGGPIMYFDENLSRYILVGLVSKPTCDFGVVTVDTRVNYHLAFISGSGANVCWV